MAYRFRHVLLIFVLALAAQKTSAQVTTGIPPFGTVDSSTGPDVIDLANLNTHIPIPIFHKAGRGTDFTYDLSYDSSIWYPVTAGSTISWQPVYNWGWRAQTEISTGYISYNTILNGQQKCVYYSYQNWVYHDAWGVPHPLAGSASSYSGSDPNLCGADNFTGFSSTAYDGSGYSITVPSNTTGAFPGATLYGRDGKIYNVPFNTGAGSATFSDANGNEITVSGSNFYDTTSSTSPVLTVSGSGTPTSPMKFTYTAPSGAQPAYVLNYTNYTVATNFGLSGTSEYKSTAAIPLVTSIVLPDNSQYTIQYEATPATPSSGACTPYAGTTCVTARISSIKFPTGGTITYTYTGGSNGVFADGSTSGMKRYTPDTGSNYWEYDRTAGTGAAYTTKITDPLGDQTSMQFQGIYQTEAQVYQGTSTLLKTVNTCYNGSASPCTRTAVTLPIASQTSTTILPGSLNLESEVATSYNSYGQLTEEDDYDYGHGAPGSLLRKQLITILTVGNNQAIQAVQIKDGSGNVKSQTSMTFDQGSLTATSGTPQHTNPTIGRGNPTTISYLVQGSTSLTKTLVYFDTGNVQTVTDVNSATTTYTYSSESASCGNSFPTGVTEAISGLTQSFAWNCTGGVLISATDENGKVISSSYTDADFWRPAYTSDQLSNQTNFTYNGQTSVESYLNFSGGNGNSTADTLTTLDGLGRVILSQRKQGPSSSTYDSVLTTYDSLARPMDVTVPYNGTAGQTCCGAPATAMTYDALSRPLTVTDPGNGTANGTVTYTYNQNDVLMTLSPAPSGEHTKSRQMEYDGLGRLSSVCEITSVTGSGTCAQNSTVTGYWTEYVYDANGNLTGVTQNAQNSSQKQMRSYAYDDLGRMTAETNPESGSKTYVYDSTGSSSCTTGYTSNGDLVRFVDNAGTNTCYYYDALHRMTDVGNSNQAVNHCLRFRYDNSSGYPGSTKPSGIVNTLGRLIEATTDQCISGNDALITDEWFSYSARGEDTDLWMSTPHSGGYLHTQASFWPNGAANTIVMVGGDGYGNQYTLDGEGRVYSSTCCSTSTSYNNASQPTQITYGSGDSDTFTFDPSNRMNKYQYNVGSQSIVGTPSWNANGTLGSLTITDPFNSANAQTCNYSHDDLSRIAGVTCTSTPSWSQSFTYDAFGNINKSGNSSFNASYSSSTNQMTQVGSCTPTYDGDGNVTNDCLQTYSWDSWNHPITVGAVTTTYDALGRMAEQNRSGTYTQIQYSPTGFKMQLITGGAYKGFVPLPGGAEAAGLYYRHPDWLGSSRLTTTSSRTVQGDVAYAPFGETYVPSGTPDVSFTGMNQDTAGYDYDFPAREYGIQGRWPSPDPAGLGAVDLANPQSFDRYAYVLNNPLALVDPTGLFIIVPPPPLPNPFYDFGDDSFFGGTGDPNGGVCIKIHVHFFGYSLSQAQQACGVSPQTTAPNNGRNCSTAPASAGQYIGATAQVAAMTAQFFSGAGPGNQTFGPGTATSQVMGQSGPVQDVLNSYYMTGQTSGLYTFGGAGYVAAGGNPVAQFVGSFRWSISGGNLSLTNTTSFRSLTYDMGPQWQRGTFAPMGNTHQTYNMSVTCH